MKRLVQFLLVLVLVQALTSAQLLLALRWEQPEVHVVLALFAASTALLAALWLSSLAGHSAREAISRASARFAEERERAQTRAEREKARLIAQGQRRLAREQRRAEARASRRALAAGVGLAAAGALLLLGQFVTLALLALSSAAGGVGGYFLRARMERRGRAPPTPLAPAAAGRQLAAPVQPSPPLLVHGGMVKADEGFELAAELRRDCVVVGRFPLCRLLLMNDANYPWLILVPARAGITEVHQLTRPDQVQLLEESTTLSRTLSEAFAADKLNVAALGNVVPQLHLHHVVRYRTDPAWPAPVWGRVPARPYSERGVGEVLERVRSALAGAAGFVADRA